MEDTEDGKVSDAANQNLVTAEVGSAPIIVTELRPNDVLLGRGAPIIKYGGNVKFRAVIKSRKKEYMATHRRVEKDLIALSIINVIAKRNGRFLQRFRPSSSQATIGADPSEDKSSAIWKIADRNVVAEKIKQALRDKESTASAKDDISQISSSSDPAQQRSALFLPPQASFDHLLSQPRHPVYGGPGLLPPSMYYPFPPSAPSHQGFQPYPVPSMALQPEPASFLAMMMQQLQQERQRTALLLQQRTLYGGTALDHHHTARGLLLGGTAPSTLGGDPRHSSSLDYNTAELAQLLQQQRLRNQLLLNQQQHNSSARELSPVLDTAGEQLQRHQQQGMTFNPVIASAEGIIARGNLKRDEDDDFSEDESSMVNRDAPHHEEKGSSPEDDKKDALKEYSDLASLSVIQTSSSSSQDIRKTHSSGGPQRRESKGTP